MKERHTPLEKNAIQGDNPRRNNSRNLPSGAQQIVISELLHTASSLRRISKLELQREKSNALLPEPRMG